MYRINAAIWYKKSANWTENVNLHVHLTVPSACTFYIAPEDGCVLHPKHVEQIV